MDALVTMSASSVLAAHPSGISHQSCELVPSGDSSHELRQHQTISTTITVHNGNNNTVKETRIYSHKETDIAPSAASVFIGGSVPGLVINASNSTIIPEVQLATSGRESAIKTTAVKTESNNHQNFNIQKLAHVVKIKINPRCEKNTNKVISAVRLNLEDISSVYKLQNNTISNDKCNDIAYANSNNSISYNDIDNDKYSRDNNIAVITPKKIYIDTNRDPNMKSSVMNDDCNFLGNELISEDLQDHANINIENSKDEQLMQQRNVSELSTTSRSSGSCFYYNSPLNMMMISNSPNSATETLDGDTSNNLIHIPPPLPDKKNSNTIMVSYNASTIACHNYHYLHQHHDRTGSLTSSGAEVDSDDNESSISCDSLNNGEVPLNNSVKFRVSRSLELRTAKKHCIGRENLLKNKKDTTYSIVSVKDVINDECFDNPELFDLKKKCFNCNNSSNIFPIVSKTLMLSKTSIPTIQNSKILDMKQTSTFFFDSMSTRVNECTYEERRCNQESNNNNVLVSIDGLSTNNCSITKYIYEDDRYYKFHINEKNELFKKEDKEEITENDDECFAGFKILDREAIRSAKGTVRGVKNRVRAGIATFLQKPSSKNYKAKDAGKVVFYTTTMGIVRETYYRCVLIKQILMTHMVKYEERDMYMSAELQTELRDRIGCIAIQVPQLFIDGQYIGDADAVERLNESGELRSMLKPYKRLDICSTCKVCGGYCLLPCPVCNGSKKSIHRNDFTTEFIALKCMNCDEVGLVRCQYC